MTSSSTGCVGDRRVERRDAANRGIEVLEQLVRDARGELRAETAGELILVRDDDAVGLLRPRRRSASQSNGAMRAQIDDHRR